MNILKTVGRYVLIVIGILGIAYILLAAILQPWLLDDARAKEIESYRIMPETITDSMFATWTSDDLARLGTHEQFMTVFGVDENSNMIRDDIEYAIVTGLRDAPFIRPALLQYAQSLQLFFLVDSEWTANAAEQKRTRALLCITESLRAGAGGDTAHQLKTNETVLKWITEKQFNDGEGARKKPFEDALALVTDTKPPQAPYCDIDPKTLLNQ